MLNLEEQVRNRGIALFCCVAQPELEIFACAAYHNEVRDPWEQVRRHPRMKEEIFEPLLNRHGDHRRPGKGRGLMVNESLRNLPLLYQLCPELRCLRNRIAAHLGDE